MMGAMRSLRRGVAALLVVAAALVAFAPGAAAHAELLRTDPAAGSTLDEAPTHISLYFGEGVESSSGAIRLYDARGNELEMGAAGHPSGDESIVRAATPEMGEGTYVVDWRVVSADGHPLHSAFTFDVGAPTGGGDAKGLVARLVSQQGSTALGAVFAVVRWLGFASITVLLGGLAFAGGVWPGGAQSDRARRHLTAAAVLGSAAALAVIAFQGAYAGGFGLGQVLRPSLWGDVLATRFGRAHLARAVLCAAAVPLVRSLPRRASAVWRGAAVVLGLAIAASVTFAGHGATGRWLTLAVTADVVHVLAASIWVGGLVGLVAWALPDGEPLDVLPAARRFSAVALVAVVVVTLTGVLQGVRQVGRLGALTSTTYGWVLLVKVAIVIVVVGVAWVSRAVVRELAGVADPAPVPVAAGDERADEEAEDADADAPPSPALLRGYLRRSVGVEVLGVVAVLVATTLLTNAVPAREVKGAPFEQTIVADPYFAQVTVDPATSGAVAIHVTITGIDGSIPSLDSLVVDLTLPEREVGPLEVRMQRLSGNHFVNDRATIPFAGTWELRATGRIGFDELSFTARVPVG